jgi:hypothetical protein
MSAVKIRAKIVFGIEGLSQTRGFGAALLKSFE